MKCVHLQTDLYPNAVIKIVMKAIILEKCNIMHLLIVRWYNIVNTVVHHITSEVSFIWESFHRHQAWYQSVLVSEKSPIPELDQTACCFS